MKLEDFVGMPLPDRNDIIWKEADAFYDIGMYAITKTGLKREEYHSVVEHIHDKQHIITAIVNLAFSCELYLKSMLSTAKGHRLRTLYKKQCNTIKELIKFELIDKDIVKNDVEFYKQLAKISSAFPNWRYYYEKLNTNDIDTINLDLFYLMVFSNCLHMLDVFFDSGKYGITNK